MATPYVVQKITLTSPNNDFDHCNGVDSASITSCTANIPSSSCRFNPPWCPVGEREIQNDFCRKTRDICSRSKDSMCAFDERCLLKNGGSHDLLQGRAVGETAIKEIDSLQKNVFRSPSKVVCSKDLTLNMGVHEKYVKEVEALKGKIQELRQNLQKQLTDSPIERLVSVSKLIWSDKSDSLAANDPVVFSPPCDLKRAKRISESEKFVEVDDSAGTKRLKDEAIDVLKFSNDLCQELLPKDEEPCCSVVHPDCYTLSFSSSPIKLSESSAPKAKVKPAATTKTVNTVIAEVTTSPKKTSIHPSLRPSLFHNVPPYIKFVNHENKAEKPFPPQVTKVLRWKITTITPLVVRKTVINSGFKLVRQSPDWAGTWGKHMRSVMFRTVRENQKINHFPGTFQIGRKDKLWKNLHHLMCVYSRREFGFIPRTYVLPQDMKMLRVAWERVGGANSTWIVKPPASARGTGIKVVNKWTDLPKKTPLIVQKYISNPYLINGNKFDLRLYAFVTSFNPLRVYLYDNGLVRFASVKYSEDTANLGDRYMHLTNYSINKLSNNYHHNEDADACLGHKWTIKTLWSYLEGVIDVKALQKRIVDLIIKTVLCGEKSISNLSAENLISQYCSYELFGIDILLDRHLTPWLLEVNISPSLHSASPLDLAVKGPMIQEILNMAGYHIPDLIPDNLKADLSSKLGLGSNEPICFDKDLYIAGLSPVEREKQENFYMASRPEYLEDILTDLTPDDVRQLIHYEDELSQIGSFQKIFPTTETHSYLKYFESPQYYNKLFDAWETKHASNRSKGIAELNALCKKGHHLNAEDVSLHISVFANDPSTDKMDGESVADALSSSASSCSRDAAKEASERVSRVHLTQPLLKGMRRRLALGRRHWGRQRARRTDHQRSGTST